MPVYAYTAKDGEGKDMHSTVMADSRYEALAMLREQGLTVVDLHETIGPHMEDRPSGSVRRRKGFALSGGRVSVSEKAIFCRQLAISVTAGVPLRDALESITEDMENLAFKSVLENVVQRLHEGKPFSESISPHARIFDSLFVSLIRTAEEAGSMPRTLEDLATSMERSERLTRKVRSIAAYPAFVAVFFCIVCVIMTVFILPQFQHIFSGFKSELPLLTRIVFGANRWLVANFPVIVGVLAALVALFVLYVRTKAGRFRMDAMKLKIPLIGTWIKQFAVARFCRNLAIMVKGGVPIAGALEIASGTCGNRAMQQALLAARERIVNGSSIAASMAREGIFPRLVIRMISVGESSGRLPEVLEKVSDVYEDQVEGSIMVATSLIEPVIICVFGVFILILVLAIYIPIFSMAAHAQ